MVQSGRIKRGYLLLALAICFVWLQACARATPKDSRVTYSPACQRMLKQNLKDPQVLALNHTVKVLSNGFAKKENWDALEYLKKSPVTLIPAIPTLLEFMGEGRIISAVPITTPRKHYVVLLPFGYMPE